MVFCTRRSLSWLNGQLEHHGSKSWHYGNAARESSCLRIAFKSPLNLVLGSHLSCLFEDAAKISNNDHKEKEDEWMIRVQCPQWVTSPPKRSIVCGYRRASRYKVRNLICFYFLYLYLWLKHFCVLYFLLACVYVWKRVLKTSLSAKIPDFLLNDHNKHLNERIFILVNREIHCFWLNTSRFVQSVEIP
jgi:hypothetical protein